MMNSLTVKLSFKLLKGKFVKRLNRFMAEIELDGEKFLAYLPNSGRMLTVLSPKCEAFVKEENSPNRKSKYTMFAVKRENIPIIVDTRFANKLTKTLIEKRLFPPLRKYRVLKENVPKKSSRIDFLLGRNGQRFYLEVKSVSYVVNEVAMFPDAPTLRGRKHVQTLIKCLKEGFKAGVLFTLQRPDARIIKPCYEIDPEFSKLLENAYKRGLNIFTQTLIFQSLSNVKIEVLSPEFSF